MTTMAISPTILEETRAQIFENVLSSFTDQDKEFLISFKKGEPQWDLFAIQNVQNFPAVQWKLYNIQTMNTSKRNKALDLLIKHMGL